MFNEKYGGYLNIFEKYLSEFIKTINCESSLKESMVYSLSSGGKRIRPVLMLAVNDALKGDVNKVLPFALALEMIHTYSLIHDDLPAMDNDDFRRGKPSNHVKFGEGIAILAGDALLNLAMEICVKESFLSDDRLKATAFLFDSAGINGMLGGQALDITFNGDKLTEELLFRVIENKTSKLITAATVIASILNGDKHFEELKDFGKNLGFIFQLTDDILDDGVKDDNITALKVYERGELEKVIEDTKSKCLNSIKCLDDNAFLEELTEKICVRKK